MKIQQAIFTSSDRGQIKGYQLVAMSDGIDRGLAKELYRWSPSQLRDDDPANWTINYFPVSADYVAVTRSVLGGPEYSDRGGLQVVTLIAVLHNQQFVKYANNPLLVARTALALGWLRLPKSMPGRLEAFDLPDRPVAANIGNQRFLPQRPSPGDTPDWDQPTENRDGGDFELSLWHELADLLRQGRRLAIIGARRPSDLAAKLISHLSLEGRRRFSFTTGLPPALHRPFHAHFLPEVNRELTQMLKAEGITIVHARPEQSNTGTVSANAATSYRSAAMAIPMGRT